jgi:hypothetical protein
MMLPAPIRKQPKAILVLAPILLDPTQSFDYIFETTDPINPDTFLIVDPSGIDHLYGVMSPDTNVLWTCKCQ